MAEIDTSIYKQVQQPGPFGALSLGDLMSLAAKSREMQTQSAVSDSLKAEANPNDPTQTNFPAAMQGVMRRPDAFVTPGLMQGFSAANQAQMGLNAERTKTAMGALTSLIGKGDKVTKDDVFALVPYLSRLDPEMIPSLTKMVADLPAGGKPLLEKLTGLYNLHYGGQPMPTTPVVQPTGAVENVPAPVQNLRNMGVGGEGPTAPGAPGAAAPAGGYGHSGGLAPATVGTQAVAATEATNLLKQGPQIANTRSMLATLGDLSDEAATGPTADFEKRFAQLAQRLGLPATLTGKELKNSEEYAKVAETLAGQMAASNHATDAFLKNAYGSNPNLQLSKLGREGITHWLQGNADAMALQQAEWAKWISAHPGQEGNYFQWLYGKKGPDGSGGFDVASFDPRVFQFERMNPTERKEFYSAIKTPKAKTEFMRNHAAYMKNGWISGEQ